jgi:sugar/nucleoside kinase (ribokinase family)
VFDVVFLGHYTHDTIVYPDRTQVVDGGAYYYGASVTARLGLRTAVITRLAREDWRAVAKMEQAGVTMLARETPASTALRLVYPTKDLDQRTIEMTTWADPFTIQEVAGVEARAYIIAASSVRGEVPLEIVRELASRGVPVALDVQGFIRVMRDGKLTLDEWPGKEAFLRYVTILKTDAVEAQLLTGQSDRRAAAQRLASLGPREVLLTHSGSVLVYHDGQWDEAPLVPRQIRGRSGRGDTCTAASLSRRLTAPPENAVLWAAAVTSLKLEEEGPFHSDLAEVQALYERLRQQHGPRRPA